MWSWAFEKGTRQCRQSWSESLFCRGCLSGRSWERHEGSLRKRVTQRRQKGNALGDDIWRVQTAETGCFVDVGFTGASTVQGLRAVTAQQEEEEEEESITGQRSVDALRSLGIDKPRLIDRLAKRRSAAEMQLSVKML
ncbi:hypothetical protein VE00_01446 [Pseudogymnoascus sp. WSF 3629]|nr:hypothetical protein VE00_01446 [Pseudogymnoascus sp. WSF 3629]